MKISVLVKFEMNSKNPTDLIDKLITELEEHGAYCIRGTFYNLNDPEK